MPLALNIGSADPKPLAEFYTRLFGPPLMEGGGYTSWVLDGNMITVGPHDEVEGPSRDPARLLWSLMSNDIERDVERYVTAGARVVRELYQDADAPQFWIATFADPDGNYFQLVEQRTTA